jgi:hypothetical protein
MTLGKLNNFRHCEQSEAIQNVLRWYRISEAPPQGTGGMGPGSKRAFPRWIASLALAITDASTPANTVPEGPKSPSPHASTQMHISHTL